MDSTVFIRSRRVLVFWLVLPLLVIVVVELGSRTFFNHQQVSCLRNQSLSRLIPEMIKENAQFDEFIKRYEVNTADSASIEDVYIKTLGTAADTTGFKITSIHLVQDRNQTQSAPKIAVNLEGIGSPRSLVAFLQAVKMKDPAIYEERIALTRYDESLNMLLLETKLSKIYSTGEGGRL
jgi:hypothetical protein